MAVGNVICAVLIALVAVNCILAEKPGDVAYDQVDGKQNQGPPSKENNNEKKQEGTISLSFDSNSPGLSSSCNGSPGPNYYLSCTQEVHCHSTNRGIALRCHGTLRDSNGLSSSSASQCKSG